MWDNSYFMYAIADSGKNTLSIQSHSNLKWMDIAHESRPKVTEAPLRSNDPTCGGIKTPTPYN